MEVEVREALDDRSQEAKRRLVEQPADQPDDDMMGALTGLDISGNDPTSKADAPMGQPGPVVPPPPKVDPEDRSLWPEPGSYRSPTSADILKTRRHCPLACCEESREANGKGWTHTPKNLSITCGVMRGESLWARCRRDGYMNSRKKSASTATT